jgi:hypothetical protein
MALRPTLLLPARLVGGGPRVARRGAVSVIAAMMAIVVSGLSLSLVLEGAASKQAHARLDGTLRALEAAETGIARAEAEISSQIDTGTDGIGNLSGSLGGASFQVVATPDAAVSARWVLRSTGTSGLSRRVIETGVERVPTGPWTYGLFAQQSIVLSGGDTSTDSYDSSLGTYASQATSVDAAGAYANSDGSVGTNAGDITLKGGVQVRGDATAGPGFTLDATGVAAVTGTTTPLEDVVFLPPTPLSVFQTAESKNDNGSWTTTGATSWNPATCSLSVSGGNTITLTGSTYFFTSLKLSGNSTLQVNGPVKIYVTGDVDLSGGTVVNTTQRAVNFQLYVHPYAVPSTFTPPATPSVKLSGGNASAYAVYAPAAAVAITGGSNVFGSVIGRTITAAGGSKIHYDAALAEQLGLTARVQRIFWRDAALPVR